MLSFKFVTSSGGAAHYFEKSDDYYSKDGPAGQWEGEGAKLLGLQGGVDTQVFKTLLEGKLPNGEQIRKFMPKQQGNGKKSKQRLGIDFTFSAPKSVSIAALVNGDQNILRAHDEAVRASIKALETKAVARKKERGLSFRQHTNNLTVATFRHDLSRTQDPQLHTHAVAMNLTQRDDGRFVALTNDEMLKGVKVIGAYYRAELAQRLEKMGYEIRSTKDGFELASVSDKAIKLFSKRSKQIEDELEKKGLNRQKAGSETKQKITQATRPTKTDADRAELREEWINVLEEAGISLKQTDEGKYIEIPTQGLPGAGEVGRAPPEEGLWDDVLGRRELGANEIAARAVNFAIAHLGERQGIFTKSEIQEQAYMRALGHFEAIEQELVLATTDGRLVSELPLYQSAKSFSKDKEAEASIFQYDKFKNQGDSDKLTEQTWVALTMNSSSKTQEQAEKLVHEAIANGRLVRAEERFTTGEMLTNERQVLTMEERGRNQVPPIMTAAAVHELFAGTTLNQGQQDAAQLILTSPNRIIGVQGYAGVGKSHLLKETMDAITAETSRTAMAEGYTVIGIAPYASQNKALSELGMESQTLASFLARTKDQEKLGPKTIVFLDESSVIPAHQMNDMLRLVEAAGSRIVLIGDRKQTQAVEAGKPFEQLQDSGMSVAHITDIRRQEDPVLKAAVVKAADGKIKAAVDTLDSHTIQIKSPEKRYTAIAKEYTSLTEDERNKTLIVSGTNAARQGINAEVRRELALTDDYVLDTYDNIDMTKAEKRLASSYQPDQVILLEGQQTGELERRTYYEILTVNAKENTLTVRGPNAELITFNPAEQGNLSAFTKEVLPVAIGDWVRVTRNNTPLKIQNGGRYKITEMTPDELILSNGSRLNRHERLHMQYGYGATVHSAQGLTSQRVIIDADSKSLTSNRAVFYVAISRPKNFLSIYTDNKAVLGDVMSREPKKYAALELRNDDLEKEYLKGALKRQELTRAMVRPSKAQTPAQLIKQPAIATSEPKLTR